MNIKSEYGVVSLLLGLVKFTIWLMSTLLATFKGLLTDQEAVKRDRPIQDSDSIGDYNFRTERFDAGTDPNGWYEDEQ